ncbi:MAG TPA: protein-L-isoaspartate O-methyltransferase [Azospirillaceae bacterium]|nr:protein-L-isoaspartate O-methyltransferase [Azospirillaceae bacterium]
MAVTLDFKAARLNMVEGQVRPNKVTDNAVVSAMLDLPRERFVPPAMKSLAYIDEDLQVAPGRFLLEPMVLARLVQEARVGRGDIALDVAPATGYSTALLGRLAGTVVAVEADAALAEQATRNLQDLGVDNAVVVSGDHAQGHAKQGPYDVILLGGAVSEVPTTLLDQLSEGGRLVCVLAAVGGVGQAKLFQRVGGRISGRTVFDANVQRLPGFEPKPRFEF